MKKVSTLIALALLAVAGTGLAVTCAQDNVPAATLLVPYFRVSRGGVTSGTTTLTDDTQDTLMAITNVSGTGLIVHATVWTKFSRPVLDFNIPMTGYDVVTFRMIDILNGHLNVNPNTQSGPKSADPCGLDQRPPITAGSYDPETGFGQSVFIRFPNPDPIDSLRSISIYDDPAFPGFRSDVLDSLDESGDIKTFSEPGAAFITDSDSSDCSGTNGTLSGDFSGYMTFDVVNYCTNHQVDEPEFFTNDAIATVGWGREGYTPNALMGDVFYVDRNNPGGNISGDPMVPIEFDSRLDSWLDYKTFYGRYSNLITDTGDPASADAAPFAFIGDGREPLGNHYGIRYLNDSTRGLQSWLLVWRSDRYRRTDTGAFVDDNLCYFGVGSKKGSAGSGLYDSAHELTVFTYDLDENVFAAGPTPSGGGPSTTPLYVFLEAQRIDLLGLQDINPSAFPGGWLDIYFPGTDDVGVEPGYNMAWVGVQHSGFSQFLSVGHSATLLNNQFVCNPSLYAEAGNVVDNVE